MKDHDDVFDLLVAANPVPDPRARPDGFEAEAPMRREPGEDRPIERRPARWWLNPGIAVAAAVAVVAGFSLFLLARGPGQDPFPAGTPTTTSPATSPATTAPLPPSGLGYVVAGAEGVELIDGRETITRIAQEGATVALDDGRGGVVYQRSPGGGEADPASISAVAAIVHVPAEADPAVLASDVPGVSLSRLYDVVEIDGRTIVVVVEFRNPGEISETGEWLVEYDLGSGSVREVAQVAGSERSVEAVTWDGSRYVVETVGDGLAVFSTVTRDGAVESWSGALPSQCTTDGPCPRLRVATPDGERLVLVDGPDIVIWNRTTDSAESILQGEAGDEVRGLRVEWPILVVNRDGAPATVYDLTAVKLDPVPVGGFADPVLDMPFFPANLPGEAERQAAAEAAAERQAAVEAERARELAELRVDGQAVDAVACAGVDGAVVYRPVTGGGLTYIVGFEEGVFIRVLGEGIETETDQVTLTDRVLDGTRLAIADLDLGGDLVTVEAVVVDGLPECTP